MNRRTLLKAGPAGVVASALGPFCRPARAVVDPMTVIACVQFAVNLAKMFNSGDSGPGIGNLLRQQVEMLRSISSQIALLSQQMNVILDRLGEIKEILDELPERVTIELCKTEIGGAALRYVNRAQNIAASGSAFGIEQARKQNVPRLWSDVIDPLYVTRTNLMAGYPRFSIIPIVAIALRVEMDALILGDAMHDEILIRLANYEDWLKRVTDGPGPNTLHGALNRARDGRDKLVEDYGSKLIVECWNDPWAEMYKAEGPFRASPATYNPYSYTRKVFLDDGVLQRPPFKEAEIELAVTEMMQSGLFSEKDRPRDTLIVLSRDTPYNEIVSYLEPSDKWSFSDPEISSRLKVLGKDRAWLEGLTQCTAQQQQLRARLAVKQVELNRAEMEFMMLTSWMGVASQSRSFISNRRLALSDRAERLK